MHLSLKRRVAKAVVWLWKSSDRGKRWIKIKPALATCVLAMVDLRPTTGPVCHTERLPLCTARCAWESKPGRSICNSDTCFEHTNTSTENKAIVHCRLGPRHPLHDGLVYSGRPPLSSTPRNLYDAAGALACAQRRNDVTRCMGASSMPVVGPELGHYVQIWRHPLNRK